MMREKKKIFKGATYPKRLNSYEIFYMLILRVKVGFTGGFYPMPLKAPYLSAHLGVHIYTCTLSGEELQ